MLMEKVIILTHTDNIIIIVHNKNNIIIAKIKTSVYNFLIITIKIYKLSQHFQKHNEESHPFPH